MSKQTGPEAQSPTPQRDPHEAIKLIKETIDQLLNDPGTPRAKQRLLEDAARSAGEIEKELGPLVAATQAGAGLPQVAMRVSDHVRLPVANYGAFIRAVRRALRGQRIDLYAGEHENEPDLVDPTPYRTQQQMPRFTIPGRQGKPLNNGEPWGTRIANATRTRGIGWDLHEVTLRLSSEPLSTRDAPPVPALTRLERALANGEDAETVRELLEAVAVERARVEALLETYREEEKLSGEFRSAMHKAADEWDAANASGPVLKKIRDRREAAERKEVALLAAERRQAEADLRMYRVLESEASALLQSGSQKEHPAKKEPSEISPPPYGVLRMRFRRQSLRSAGAEHPGMKYDVPLTESDVLALLDLIWDYGRGHLLTR